MTYLNVPGAELYYEVVGKGPLLLCISGGNGNADPWQMVASQLQEQFTVCMWDRRGFSRSYLVGAQDYSQRLERDADDAAALITHLSPSNSSPVVVIGNSSGAIVSLMLLLRHPDLIHTVIPHEPPAYPFLPPELFESVKKTQLEIYDRYRAGGMLPAFELFASLARMDSEAEKQGFSRVLGSGADPDVRANTMYWFERELLVYPLHVFDVEEIRRLKGKLILVNGEDSHQEAPHVLANKSLGKMLGEEVQQWAGQHLGFATHAEGFAGSFKKLMQKRGVL